MGFTEVLTIVFIVLKLMGFISWSWFFVLLPEIIALAIYLVLIVINIRMHIKAQERFEKIWKDKF